MSNWKTLLLRIGEKGPEYGTSSDYKDHIVSITLPLDSSSLLNPNFLTTQNFSDSLYTGDLFRCHS